MITNFYCLSFFFFFNDPATTEIYTLSLHDALPISFRTYVFENMPVTAVENASSWMNVSATGFWMRLFGPTPEHGIVALVDAPSLGRRLVRLSQLVAVGLTLWAARKAATVEARDRGYAIATTGMVLVSPISWSHSFLLLMVPVGLMLARLPAGWWRVPMWVALVVVWLPANFFAHLTYTTNVLATTDP